MRNKISAISAPPGSFEKEARSLATAKSRYVHYFFVAMACIFPLLAVLGFAPSYQAMSGGALKVHWLVHVHGAIMGGWLLIFLVQTILAAKGNLKFHRQLGLFSIFYAVLVWLSMLTVSLRSGAPWNVLVFHLHVPGLFGLFFTWGILTRKNAPAHKRLLFLATLVLLLAAIGRIQWLPGISMGPPVFFIYLDTLLIPLFVYDFFSGGRMHKITLLGSACLIAAQLMVLMV
ncbi:MAG TPA: hypothetical protein VIU12_25460 [Chryseolinea sp.]